MTNIDKIKLQALEEIGVEEYKESEEESVIEEIKGKEKEETIVETDELIIDTDSQFCDEQSTINEEKQEISTGKYVDKLFSVESEIISEEKSEKMSEIQALQTIRESVSLEEMDEGKKSIKAFMLRAINKIKRKTKEFFNGGDDDGNR